MNLLRFLFVFAIIFKLAKVFVSADCVIDITKLNGHEPLYLDHDPDTLKYFFKIPQDGKLNFETGQRANLVCTSTADPQHNRPTNIEITCRNNGEFTADSKPFDAQAFRCMYKNMITPKKEKGFCADYNGQKSETISIGFLIPGILDHPGYVKLYETCYNNHSNTAMYATHTIHGSSISKTMKSQNRPQFKPFGVSPNVHIDDAYKDKSQYAWFTSLLGEKVDSFYQHNKDLFFSRGHLNPNGDQLFVSWREATFFYVNTVPEWQIVNGQNYMHLEREVAKQAFKLNKDLKIITGAFGDYSYAVHHSSPLNMTLKSRNLHSQQLPIPKWLWKVVIDEATMEMIAFVSLNDPHVNSKPEEDELLCPDVCNELKWEIPNRKNFEKGYTFCCKVSDLLEKVPFIPVQYVNKDMKSAPLPHGFSNFAAIQKIDENYD